MVYSRLLTENIMNGSMLCTILTDWSFNMTDSVLFSQSPCIPALTFIPDPEFNPILSEIWRLVGDIDTSSVALSLSDAT